jgi:signal transduction histidine kinase
MRVGDRLYLAVLPAVFGVVLLAALAYWGQYKHTVPALVLAVSVIGVFGSLFLAWRNTRYVAQRIERLAEGGPRRAPRATDELETIERVVDTLSSEVTVARETGEKHQRAASARVSEYASLLAETSAAVARRLDDVRLPLHILLENHFGELNENQEEMLASARRAAEEAESALNRLNEIAQLDQGALSLRRDSIRVGDMMSSLLPTLRARAGAEGVRLDVNLAPALPRVLGDPARLREALSLLLTHRVEHTPPDDTVRIDVDADRKRIRIRVSHAPQPGFGAEEMLARRLIEAHGGQIETSGGETEITLPVHAITGEMRAPDPSLRSG